MVGLAERLALVVSDDANADSLRTLAARSDVELDILSIEEGTTTRTFDVREVHEDIVSVVSADKTEALLIVEELHCAGSHCVLLLSCSAGHHGDDRP
jgi:hypothetical protein